MGGAQRVAQLNIELVVVDVVQEHVHPCQVIRGVVDFLAVEPVFDDVFVKLFLGLQQQRAGAARRVIDFVDAGLLVQGQLGNQSRHLLRGKKFSARLTCIRRIVGDKKFVGVAEQINMTGIEAAKFQFTHPFKHVCQALVFVSNGTA